MKPKPKHKPKSPHYAFVTGKRGTWLEKSSNKRNTRRAHVICADNKKRIAICGVSSKKTEGSIPAYVRYRGNIVHGLVDSVEDGVFRFYTRGAVLTTNSLECTQCGNRCNFTKECILNTQFNAVYCNDCGSFGVKPNR